MWRRVLGLPIISVTVLVALATLIALLGGRGFARRAHQVLRTLLGALQNLLRRSPHRDDQ
ncbi:hypothetical protein [Nocardia sp. alder85J]|uniref:hypothetical protein n=1 Tax=Nocardia sp. alder85J TaxID=2862949 RepID=UPI001CD24359|nr:hypothetical protein [Nocardia sp. alder85J]MCX4098388.1 hypothetical protein [Nocardia sp. alder85J]